SVAAAPGTVCGRVQLQLDQTAVVTRSAFDATLQIENDDDTPITNVGVTLVVHDSTGADVTSLFQVTGPSLTGLDAADGTGTLASGASGQAVFTLVPTNDAAPGNATRYYVSGALTFQEDGMDLVVPFAPATITVMPNPSLTIRYFQQRD